MIFDIEDFHLTATRGPSLNIKYRFFYILKYEFTFP